MDGDTTEATLTGHGPPGRRQTAPANATTLDQSPGEEPARTDSEDDGVRRSLRRSAAWGMVLWPGFFLLDLYMVTFVYPSEPVLPFAILRIIGLAAVAGAYWGATSPRVPVEAVHAMTGIGPLFLALLIAMMALWCGGLTSVYVHGVSLPIMIMAMIHPTAVRRSAWYAALSALSFPAVMAVAAWFVPTVRSAWTSTDALAFFGANYFFVAASAACASLIGHTVWAARQQLYEARKLGRYRLKARIASGGMNEIWLAWDQGIGRDVALKILRRDDAVQAGKLTRFTREARATGQLRSPHTVRVFDVGASDDGVYYIAMEYLEGTDLRQLLRSEGPLPLERVISLMKQACRSLSEAHAHGIVHRDIKPANLIVTASNDGGEALKVLDFGVAKWTEPEGGATATQFGVAIGTPHYMSPEAWMSRAVDARSDIYSLGATMYRLLTGHYPFADSSIQEICRAHFEDAPVPPGERREGLPRELDELILRCLAKAPEARFSSASDLESALTELERATS